MDKYKKFLESEYEEGHSVYSVLKQTFVESITDESYSGKYGVIGDSDWSYRIAELMIRNNLLKGNYNNEYEFWEYSNESFKISLRKILKHYFERV